jgi:hypothetical protein
VIQQAIGGLRQLVQVLFSTAALVRLAPRPLTWSRDGHARYDETLRSTDPGLSLDAALLTSVRDKKRNHLSAIPAIRAEVIIKR